MSTPVPNPPPGPVPPRLNSTRRVVRTVFAAVVGVAAMLPLIYSAATRHDPAQATGWSALLLGIAAAITRVMAVPSVELWLQRFLPFLAADPDTEGTAPTQPRRTTW